MNELTSSSPFRTMTVAHTLSVISYHIIANPDILRRLQDELDAAFPDSRSLMKWGQLEQLPYIVYPLTYNHYKSYLISFQSAIIQEGLR